MEKKWKRRTEKWARGKGKGGKGWEGRGWEGRGGEKNRKKKTRATQKKIDNAKCRAINERRRGLGDRKNDQQILEGAKETEKTTHKKQRRKRQSRRDRKDAKEIEKRRANSTEGAKETKKNDAQIILMQRAAAGIDNEGYVNRKSRSAGVTSLWRVRRGEDVKSLSK